MAPKSLSTLMAEQLKNKGTKREEAGKKIREAFGLSRSRIFQIVAKVWGDDDCASTPKEKRTRVHAEKDEKPSPSTGSTTTTDEGQEELKESRLLDSADGQQTPAASMSRAE
jgi:hypothetical protein